MKKHLNPPSNVEAFNQHYGQYTAAQGAITIGTILAIITELAIIVSLIKSHILTFIPMIPTGLAFVAGGIIVLLLAKGRVHYAMEVAKSWLSIERSGKGVALNRSSLGWDSVLITHLIFAAVFSMSAAISYLGSITMVTDAYTPPTLERTDDRDAATLQQVTELNKQFSLDSTTISKGYKKQNEAVWNNYTAQISVLQKEMNKKKWLKTKNQSEIDALIAERKQKTAEIKEQQAASILDLSRRKVETIAEINSVASQTRGIVVKRNVSAEKTSLYLYEKATKWFPIIIIASMLLIVFASVIIAKFNKRAGIEEVYMPSEYELMPSIASEFKDAFASLFSSGLRRAAYKIKSASWETPENSADELVRINIKKYNEKVFDVGNKKKPPQQNQQPQKETPFKPDEEPPIRPPRVVGFAGDDIPVDDKVKELVNTYRVNRQQYNIYSNKDGKPETINAGLSRAANNMIASEEALAKLGYKIVVTRKLISAEKIS